MPSGTWYELGASYLSIGWRDQAMECFEQAIKENPQNQAAWIKLGHTHESMGNGLKAVEVMERAAQAMPEDTLILFTLGLYYDRYERSSAFYKLREMYEALRAMDEVVAEDFYEHFIRNPYICRNP
jgi:tetratricopeptide (TPR) repeat protein